MMAWTEPAKNDDKKRQEIHQVQILTERCLWQIQNYHKLSWCSLDMSSHLSAAWEKLAAASWQTSHEGPFKKQLKKTHVLMFCLAKGISVVFLDSSLRGTNTDIYALDSNITSTNSDEGGCRKSQVVWHGTKSSITSRFRIAPRLPVLTKWVNDHIRRFDKKVLQPSEVSPFYQWGAQGSRGSQSTNMAVWTLIVMI